MTHDFGASMDKSRAMATGNFFGKIGKILNWRRRHPSSGYDQQVVSPITWASLMTSRVDHLCVTRYGVVAKIRGYVGEISRLEKLRAYVLLQLFIRV